MGLFEYLSDNEFLIKKINVLNENRQTCAAYYFTNAYMCVSIYEG